jgi:predicted metal-binding protein
MMDYMELVRSPTWEIEGVYKKLSIYDWPTLDNGQMRRMVGKVYIPKSQIERPSTANSKYGPLLKDPLIGKESYHEEVPYSTGSGTRMSLYVQIISLAREAIPMLTEWEHVASCGDCKGSSGGCPGFAPRFDTIKPKLNVMHLLVVTVDMAWAMEHTTKKMCNTGLSMPWANRISAGYARRVLSPLKANKANKKWFTIGLGSCAGSWHKCRPSCQVILGKKCQHPALRSFSMEAVGIDCDMLHFHLFGDRLPWAYKGIKGLPTYMTRYAGILADENDADDITLALRFAMETDKSRTFEPTPRVPIYDAEILPVPSDHYVGCTQAFYMFGTERTGYYE